MKLNSKLSTIGTIVNGEKLNVGISVANHTTAQLAKINLTPGKWVVICCGWNPINTSILEVDSGFLVNSGNNGFSISCIFNISKTKTIFFNGTNYAGEPQVISGNYKFIAIRIA